MSATDAEQAQKPAQRIISNGTVAHDWSDEDRAKGLAARRRNLALKQQEAREVAARILAEKLEPALARLTSIALDEDLGPESIRALLYALDRMLGKPGQEVVQTDADGNTADSFAEAKAQLEERLARLNGHGEGA